MDDPQFGRWTSAQRMVMHTAPVTPQMTAVTPLLTIQEIMALHVVPQQITKYQLMLRLLKSGVHLLPTLSEMYRSQD
jgi:hypothetical protein